MTDGGLHSADVTSPKEGPAVKKPWRYAISPFSFFSRKMDALRKEKIFVAK